MENVFTHITKTNIFTYTPKVTKEHKDTHRNTKSTAWEKNKSPEPELNM